MMNCKECSEQKIFGSRTKKSIENCRCEISDAKNVAEFLAWTGEFGCLRSYRPDTPVKSEVVELLRRETILDRRDTDSKEYTSIVDFIINVLDTLGSYPSILSYLDIGCGTGRISMNIGDSLSLDPYICDLTDRTTIDKGKCDFRIIDNGVLSYNSSKFDLITIIKFLHHVDDPFSLVQEIYRIMDKGGYCVIHEFGCKSWKDVYNYDTFHDLIQYGSDRICPPVKGYRSRDGWRELFLQAGFKLVTTGCTPFNPVYGMYVDTFQKQDSR